MPRTYFFIWDDSEEGNVPHLAEHDVTLEEAAFVVEHALDEQRSRSRTSDKPVVFGYTPAGRHLIVIYEEVAEATIYVNTAYEVPPPSKTG